MLLYEAEAAFTPVGVLGSTVTAQVAYDRRFARWPKKSINYEQPLLTINHQGRLFYSVRLYFHAHLKYRLSMK